GESAGESASLRREAVRRTLRSSGRWDFGKGVDSRGVRGAAAAGTLAGGLAGGGGGGGPPPGGGRAGGGRRPRRRPGGGRRGGRGGGGGGGRGEGVGRNRVYGVGVRVGGVVRAEATLEVTFERFPPVRKALRVRKREDGSGRFEVRLSPDEVQRNFRF